MKKKEWSLEARSVLYDPNYLENSNINMSPASPRSQRDDITPRNLARMSGWWDGGNACGAEIGRV